MLHSCLGLINILNTILYKFFYYIFNLLCIYLNTKNIIASQPKAWRYSKLAGLRMLKWLDDLPNGEADKAMKELYLYASSQSDKSSVYWKLS